MAQPEKIEAVASYKAKLEEKPNFILTDYSGLSVEDITSLRAQLRAANSEMKVVKNNLFLIALKESDSHKENEIDFGAEYKGPIAVIFSQDDLPSVAKICKEFGKKTEKLTMKSGYLDGQVLDGKEVIGIAGLPSKSELLSKIASGLNGPTRTIASGMNQVIAGLARAVNAVAEKNNNK